MKKFILIVFLLQVMVVVLAGKHIDANMYPPAQFVDKETGLVVKADTPENSVASYYSLLQQGGYKAAYELLSSESKKDEFFQPDSLKYADLNFKVGTAKLAQVFPAIIEDNFAVVAFIRKNSFPGEAEAALLGMELLVKEGNRWNLIATSLESMEQVKKVLRMFSKLTDSIAKESFEEFDNRQQEQIIKQLAGLIASNEEAMEEVIRIEKEAKNPKKKKKSTEESVYNKVYDENDPHAFVD